MTGLEIIEWAVRKCETEKVAPDDSAIVRMIRYHLIDVNDVTRKPRKQPPVFKNATCKGSYVLGSACGHCERCAWERAEMGQG